MKFDWLFLVGIALLVGLTLLLTWGPEWAWLAEQQTNPTFKFLSGGALAAYLLHQWWLAVARGLRWNRMAKRAYEPHRYFGVLAPIVFYVHSIRWGYGFLILLSTTYVSNVAIGMIGPERFHRSAPWYRAGWTVLHVAFAAVVTALAASHAWFAFYYE